MQDARLPRHEEPFSRTRQVRTLDGHSEQRDPQALEQLPGEKGVDELELQRTLSPVGSRSDRPRYGRRSHPVPVPTSS